MILLYPWALLGLIPIISAAIWALARPTRQVVIVSSLRLWKETIESLGSTARKARRITIGWVCLLIGALCAIVAVSRPLYYSHRPARTVAIAIYPSAEIAAVDGENILAKTVADFLHRLSPTDRVRVILPTILAEDTDKSKAFLTPQQAIKKIREIKPLPVPAEKLTLPEALREDIQHVYRFAPACLPEVNGRKITTIALPATPGEVTIDAFTATAYQSSSQGVSAGELFIALRNHTAETITGKILITDADGGKWESSFNLAPHQRSTHVYPVPSMSKYYSARLIPDGGLGSAAFVVRQSKRIVSVACIGRADPLLLRFVKINPALKLTDDPSSADVLIIIGENPDADTPSLVIAPPSAPPGWQRAGKLHNIALRQAGVLTDSPIMKYVDFSNVAIRYTVGWQPSGISTGKPLLTYKKDALIVATMMHRSTGTGARSKRVYVAFDISTENTNFAMTDAFVIFLANVFEYLAPQAKGEVSYESLTPLQAGPRRDWKPLVSVRSPNVSTLLLLPGIYQDPAGQLHAVSLTGLKSARPNISPAEQVKSLQLPPPRPIGKTIELWKYLAFSALLFWLIGWYARMR